MSRSHLSIFASLLMAVLILTGCSNKKRAARGKPLKNRNAIALANRLEKSQFQFEWIGMKIATETEFDGNRESFKANIRMKRDSAIWISVSPLMGVEMLRVLITQDSVKYVSKIPRNKHYYKGDFKAISEKLGMEVDFDMIQALLVGNPILFEKNQNFRSKIDDQQYVLISDFSRKLKRLTGIDEKDLEPDADTITVDATGRKYDRLVRKADEDELIVRRYWLNGYTYKLERTIFDDLHTQRSVEITHDDFESIEGQSLPRLTRLTVQQSYQQQEVEIKISRLRLNRPYDLPFDIPDDYERKYYD
ncbi:DUF4292 domain-containing protein [Halocola ammonii]